MMADNKEHFTAVLEVHKTTQTPSTTVRGENLRATQEVARLVIRAADLDTLRKKITLHTELIGE